MPGLDRKGPTGNGRGNGRRQGMCRRTEELRLGGVGQGQGVREGLQQRGGLRCEPGFEDQKSTGFSPERQTAEVIELRSKLQNAHTSIEALEHKIKELEEKLLGRLNSSQG